MRPVAIGVPFVRPVAESSRPHDTANMAVRALDLWRRRRQGSPFHSLTAIHTASQPRKNPKLRNGWSGESNNGIEASHMVIQTAMVTQPRHPNGRLPPKNGLRPNQYRGPSPEVRRIEGLLDLAVPVIRDNVAGDELPGDLHKSNCACLLLSGERTATSSRFWRVSDREPAPTRYEHRTTLAGRQRGR